MICHSGISYHLSWLYLIYPYTHASQPSCLWDTLPALPQRQHRWKEETAFISIPATTILTRLLPDAATLCLEACAVDATTAQIILRVRATQLTAPCPLCTTPAHRIHSHYERTLADLPWAAYGVRLQLRVRKWFGSVTKRLLCSSVERTSEFQT